MQNNKKCALYNANPFTPRMFKCAKKGTFKLKKVGGEDRVFRNKMRNFLDKIGLKSIAENYRLYA